MGEYPGGYGVMGVYGGPKVSSDGLVLSLDAANQKLKRNALFYKWFVTNGTNPTTKAGFDAFFAASPQSSGIDEAREINWLVVADRPSYITQTTSFAWEVTGFLIITEPGEYIFNTRSDDGNELQINGQVLTSFYGGRGVPNPGDVSSPITLGVGAHPFQYRMQQGAGGAGAQVRWQRPSSSTYEVIPSSNFAVGIDNNVFPDLVGNNNGVLINGVGYNSDNGGSLVFDGVDDCVSIPKPITSNLPYTVLQWIKPNVALPDTTSSGSRKTPLVGPGPIWNPGYWMTARIFRVHAQTEYRDVTINWVGDTGWHQVGQIFDGTTCYTAIDGSVLLGTRTAYNPPSSTTILIGAETTTGGTPNWNGNISNTTFYNRALTASEIQQNFIATRSRFGI
jgi:hypothetical protein